MKDPRLTLRDWLITGTVPVPGAPHAEAILVSAAESQGLIGLLADAVEQHSAWSSAAREGLRHSARDCLVRGTRQLDLAARVHYLLLEHGLRSLPLKGAALAEWLYDSPAHRPMSDVDMLALDDFNACRRVLSECGFATLAAAEHAWAFRDPHTAGIVELHRSVTSCPKLFPSDADGLWQRRVSRHGQIPCTPSSADLLVLLALHASFQHGLVLSLSQWIDFRRLAEGGHLDAPALAPLASHAPTARAAAAALLAAEIAVAAPLSPEQRGWRLRTLSPRLRARIAERRASPGLLLTPATPRLARVRWEIAIGQRRQLLWATLFPSDPAGELRPPLTRLAHAARRVCRLAVPPR